ncbi:unnamed protein product, partial [Brassica oleracea var. botrytis]
EPAGRPFYRPSATGQISVWSTFAHLVIKSFDGVVDTSRAAYIENGGDDDDGGYDYAPAA